MGLHYSVPVQQKLVHYIQLIARWNKTFNLTAIRDVEEMVSKHLLDSLAVQPYVEGCSILDVGSGAGLPGIPFAITSPDKKFTLIDSNGKMLATADIMAQMADRTYLEKLLLLYYELDEARIHDYGDEVDLLHQSKGFYARMSERFESQLSSTNRFMIRHFQTRWKMDADLYQLAIDNQRDYLTDILTGAGRSEDIHDRG